MIDIHTHILHGLGESTDNVEDALNLVRLEKELGVSKIILTPYQYENSDNKDVIIEKYNELMKECSSLGIEILLGAKIKYYDNMISDLKNGKLLTINNSEYIFVEFTSSYDVYIPDVVHELKMNGYKTIVANVEKYENLKYVDCLEIEANGGSIHIDFSTFTNKKELKRVKRLIKDEIVDYMGTGLCNDKEICENLLKNKERINKKYKKVCAKLFERNTIF